MKARGDVRLGTHARYNSSPAGASDRGKAKQSRLSQHCSSTLVRSVALVCTFVLVVVLPAVIHGPYWLSFFTGGGESEPLLAGGQTTPQSGRGSGLVDESVMPPIVIRSTDQVCAMCTDGLVYVHLGRGAFWGETVYATPQSRAVQEELYVQLNTSSVFTAASGSADEVVSRCLAQLANLGMLGNTVEGTMTPEMPPLEPTASVMVDFDSATPQTSLGVGGRCPAFLAEVRPSTNTSGTVKMDVSYPRLPSWPLPYALNPALHGGTDAHGTLPPYFGTVAVRETDVDKDVRPPLSVALTEDRGAVVIRFGEDETSTRPEPFEMRCSSYFMSVFIGRYGRQHNQVQEMMHTLALSNTLNRTFIVPVLVPATYIPYLRYDAQTLYGFNALRREGGYCLVTYEEARRMFKVMEAEGTPLTLQRFNYYGDPRPTDAEARQQMEWKDWWEVPQRSRKTQQRVYSVDGWFQDSALAQPPVITVSDRRRGAPLFTETGNDVTADAFFPQHNESHLTRLARMRMAVKQMVDMLGDDHAVANAVPAAQEDEQEDQQGARTEPQDQPQPRLAVLSGHMAFYVRPPLVALVRLMGLLRPSPAVNADADRFYGLTAPSVRWPVSQRDTATTTGAAQTGQHAEQHILTSPSAAPDMTSPAELYDTLRVANFKYTIGIHVRRREGLCTRDLNRIGNMIVALDGRYQLENTAPGWSNAISTFRTMEMDCLLGAGRVVELYRQYNRWLRRNVTQNATQAAQLVPPLYLAYDDQSARLRTNVDQRLKLMSTDGARRLTWGKAQTYPSEFVASYDRRVKASFRGLYDAAAAVVDQRGAAARTGNGAPRQLLETDKRVKMIDALHAPGLKEMQAMAVDYFILTNVGVFRGVVLSTVSTNVMLRRWARGLPCHGVLAGYLESAYAAMW